ncbi:sensor histidine kinase [Actinoallomurus vinaceus]|uniref:sensor histidine kinase n=1 Tax=Actinoallomurus vinaceus TaxID=1080074 RepID=UPI0031F00EC8
MREPDPPPVFPRRLSRRRLIALDAAAAAGSTLVLLAIALARPVDLPTWATCLLAGALGLPVAVRRLWPLPVFGVVFAASVVAMFFGIGWNALFLPAFALYMVALTASRHPREPTLVIAGISVFGVLVGTMAGPRGGGTGIANLILTGPPVLGGAWTIGRAVRERRAYAARAAEQLAEGAVTEERLRIARELHDVVSHTLSLIGVKAGVAGYVLRSRTSGDEDAEVREALDVIESTSRDALVEMRHMLGMLRSDEASPELRPAPGLAGLPELRERAAMAGVRVDLTVDGVDGLPEGMGRSVYRIVQEAVTNVVRHAAPARCRVVVEGDKDEVRIRVTDDGPGDRVLPGTPGHGIIGMRERAHMHGGTLTAGPRPEGGFEVSARLPRQASQEAPSRHPSEDP